MTLHSDLRPGMPARDPATAVLRMQNLDKVYPNGTVALRALHLDIAEGEFVSLLGPSGCGKSTALKIAADLAGHSAGRITRLGTAEGTVPKVGEISFVFQEPNLMPWATVFDNVYLPLRMAGEGRAAATDRIREVLEMVGLAGFERAYPRELSGGMKMRVSIARAFVTRPKLLLMDEPFAALDEITRNKISHDLLDMWSKTRSTVMFVTHSVFESVFLSSRILVMAARPGRIIGEIGIGEPYPRRNEFRLTEDYSEKCRAVSGLLSEAIDA